MTVTNVRFATRNVGGDGAADGADLAFQFAHAGFVGVVVDNARERFVLHFALIGLRPFSSSWRGTRYLLAISSFSRSV